jgi:hypothetical protein
MTVEILLQGTRSLPQNEQLRLASLLIQQAQSLEPSIETKREALKRVRGMFKGMPGTEEFQAERREELELEERKFAERST